MAWTDAETVRKHLPGLTAILTSFQEVAVRLDGSGDGRLPHNGIVESSESVKRLSNDSILGPEAVELPAETWVDLPDSLLVPGELAVADGWQLGTVYQESRDYLVDTAQGKIRRIAGGSIGAGATVQVWYQHYDLLVKDTDYTINYATGEIALATGSSLPVGIDLRVDYELNAASAIDDLIPEAITEAEDKILRRLKSDYSASSTDQGLVTGATELALASICRSLAARALGDGLPQAGPRGERWLKLAAQYELTAANTLKPFLSIPTLSAGGTQGNLNWGWS